MWYAEGPPAAALNASTQLTEACLHQHIDTIGTVHNDEMGYVQGWVDEAVGASWDARDSLLAHPPTSHDGAPSQSAPASRQS